MSRPLREWKVLPHEPLTQLDDRVMTVVGFISMPLGKLPRRMTAVRLRDGRLVIFSAIALDEPSMASLEHFGKPSFMVVPSSIHRLDARIWKQRYPSIQVIAPEGAVSKVEEVVPVDATSGTFDDPTVTFLSIPGTNAQDAALQVDGPTGTTLVFNDIIGNIRHPAGLGGWFLRAVRFAGDEPHIPLPVKMKMVRDKPALRAKLLEWAELPALTRILMSHGAPIETDPRGALRRLAAELAQ